MHFEHAVTVRPTTTPRALAIAAMFGLPIESAGTHPIIPPVDVPIEPGRVVLITGPSGSGKSTLLRLIAERIAQTGSMRAIELEHAPPARCASEAVIDHFAPERSLESSAHLLATVGLADAFIMLRRVGELSEGQRARLCLARAMHTAEHAAGGRSAAMLADEFAATLDRLTATTIARNIARWVRQTAMHTFIAATTHDDLAVALQPDVDVRISLGGAIEVTTHDRSSAGDAAAAARRRLPDGWRIEPGTLDDYRALSRFHYRPAMPRAVTGVDVITRQVIDAGRRREVLAALVRVMPRLSCRLRNVATGGRYEGISRRQAAVLINREVRTIARVVVDPRCRGMGLAATLVKHALANAETIYTEALAAMGRVHPFFERAGMQRFDRPPHARDARLRDALAAAGLDAASLVDVDRIIALAETGSREGTLLTRELQQWARCGNRRISSKPLREIVRAAAGHLLSTPVYYIHRTGDRQRTASDAAALRAFSG